MACPIPEPAPVMTAVLPCKVNIRLSRLPRPCSVWGPRAHWREEIARQVWEGAVVGPSAERRDPPREPTAARSITQDEPLHPPSKPSRQPKQPPRREQSGKHLPGHLLGGGSVTSLDVPAPKLNEHVVERDFDRARFEASAAQRRGIGELSRRSGGSQEGRENRSDRPAVHRAVSVPADVSVHRAHVETCAATNAIEHVLKLGITEQLGAAIVHDDDVNLFGSVLFERTFRSGDDVEVGGELLPRGASREQVRHDLEIAPGGNDALHAHQHDVRIGERGHHAPVAFVGEEHHAARLGDGEVAAGDADLRLLELLAQPAARIASQDLGLGRELLVVFFFEELLDPASLLVDGGQDDVRRRFVGELDDPFSEIGLHHVDPGLFEHLVDADLLGEHRLRLDHPSRLSPLHHIDHHGARFFGVGRKMHVSTARAGVGAEPLEVVVEVVDGVRADRASSLAPLLPRSERLGADRFGSSQLVDGEPHRGAQEVVAQRDRGPAVEGGGRLEAHRPTPEPFSRARSTSSAMCTPWTGMPFTFIRPVMFIRHPRSVPTT